MQISITGFVIKKSTNGIIEQSSQNGRNRDTNAFPNARNDEFQ